MKDPPIWKNSRQISQKTKEGRSAIISFYQLIFIFDVSKSHLILVFRWIVYDAEWKEDDGRKVGKILLIAYSPDANPDAS